MSNKKKGTQVAAKLANNQLTNYPAPDKSGNFVIVKSKLPYGLSFVTPDDKVHKINGMNQGLVVKSEGLSGLYATTRLDADAWDYFTRAYAKQPYLQKQHIFAEVKEKYADAKAREIEKDASTKTGLEQLNPNNIPNIKKAENTPNGAGVVA